MCNMACLSFGRDRLGEAELAGKAVLEVGALDVNGSMRGYVMDFKPSRYVGVDIEMGPGVDEVCDATQLVERYGRESFDVVLATELMEHVQHWREVIHNFKQVLRPGGVVLITTRSRGFGYHGYPFDFWRYEVEDMRQIFADFEDVSAQPDPLSPGVFVVARKPAAFRERDLSKVELFSILKGRRSRVVDANDIAMFKVRYNTRRAVASVTPKPIKNLVRRLTGQKVYA